VQPATPGAEPKMFSACCVDKLKTACRLRDDLELDMHALSVTCSLLERIRQLESELHALQARLPDVRPSLRY
ncbi:MAG TPA: chaperone modulator CbpM, partial [Rhodocyclaceae bacterium]|nr:chaperone modulator CbpM [Rhodocyclaceae bacterium]